MFLILFCISAAEMEREPMCMRYYRVTKIDYTGFKINVTDFFFVLEFIVK